MMTFLLADVSQRIWPGHVETYMAARRIEALRGGLVISGAETSDTASLALTRLTKGDFKNPSQRFRSVNRSADHGQATHRIVHLLVAALDGGITINLSGAVLI